jgi:hypothetical protein
MVYACRPSHSPVYITKQRASEFACFVFVKIQANVKASRIEEKLANRGVRRCSALRCHCRLGLFVTAASPPTSPLALLRLRCVCRSTSRS